MTYNLTIIDGNLQPVSDALVTITRMSDAVVEFSGNTDANGTIAATLSNSITFNVVVSKNRLYQTYNLTTGTVTITVSYQIGTRLAFVGISQMTANPVRLRFSGISQMTANQVRLWFSGTPVLTQKNANLKFWGVSAAPCTDSELNYQVTTN
jgi:hypothetical protein